MKLKLL
jgi:hypothetical protein